jgi:hypothetical protein
VLRGRPGTDPQSSLDMVNNSLIPLPIGKDTSLAHRLTCIMGKAAGCRRMDKQQAQA